MTVLSELLWVSFVAIQYTDPLRNKKSTRHDALRIVLVDFFYKDIKNGYSYIAITDVVIVGVKISLQEICFTNIHRIYKFPFFMEQAEFVI